MVDHAIYTSISGAKESLRKTSLVSNNLANVNTIGYHADYQTIESKAANQKGMQTRIAPHVGMVYTDHNSGPIHYTGHPLDVAIKGSGFFAVQNKTGKEGFTRAGDFEITQQGRLVTQSGYIVVGEDGVINIPPGARVNIDKNGVVTAKLKDEAETNIAEIGRLKLVNPPVDQVTKGEDGLYYPKGDANIAVSRDILLAPESLEGSNVDPVRALVELVDMSRNFDSQTKVLRVMEENANKSNTLLDLQR